MKREEERRYISQVGAEAFLIYDKSFREMDSPFVQWLKSEGFSYAWRKGHCSLCNWMYVNITHKVYAYGMIGVRVVRETGNHAITIEEFKTIYSIYKKYEGKDIFEFDEAKEAERDLEKEKGKGAL